VIARLCHELTLLAVFAEKVVGPAEAKLKTLEERRRAIEEELIKPG
jgi:hypothetical protein